VGRPPPTILPVRKLDEWTYYGIRILAVDYFVLSGCIRSTDRQMDGQTDRFRQQDRALAYASQSHRKKKLASSKCKNNRKTKLSISPFHGGQLPECH